VLDDTDRSKDSAQQMGINATPAARVCLFFDTTIINIFARFYQFIQSLEKQ